MSRRMLGPQRTQFGCWHHVLLEVAPWTSYFTSLRLGLLRRKPEKATSKHQGLNVLGTRKPSFLLFCAWLEQEGVPTVG